MAAILIARHGPTAQPLIFVYFLQ